MPYKQSKESGQILIGGTFFLIFVMLMSAYFISMTKSVRRLYTDSLHSKMHTIKKVSQYAHVLNQISFNNQNILISIMSAQVAYIRAVEIGLMISYEQPYWKTYETFQSNERQGALAEKSSNIIEKSFKVLEHQSAHGFYVAKALSDENKKLLTQLPTEIQKFFIQSSASEVHSLALEFLNKDLHPSHFTKYPFFSAYSFGLEKVGTTLEHHTGSVSKVINTALPMLTTAESDLVINFDDISKYAGHGKNFEYGVSYVNPEFGIAFLNQMQWQTNAILHSTIRLSHQLFKCSTTRKLGGDFIIENDWRNICQLNKNQFLKSFFSPAWAALVTNQGRKSIPQ